MVLGLMTHFPWWNSTKKSPSASRKGKGQKGRGRGPRIIGEVRIGGKKWEKNMGKNWVVYSSDLGLSENSVPLNPMVKDHYPY